MKAIPDSADADWFGTKTIEAPFGRPPAKKRPPFGKKKAEEPADSGDEEPDPADTGEDVEYTDEEDNPDEAEPDTNPDDEEEAVRQFLKARRERRRGLQARETGPGSIHTDKWDRCVEHVKKRGGGYEPHAVCTASLGYEGSIKAGHRRRGKKAKESDPLDLELQAIFRESERGLDPSTDLFEAKTLFTKKKQRSQPGKVWSKTRPREIMKQPIARRGRP